MLMSEEMVALYRRLFEAGISICVDTSGHVKWDNIEKVLPYVDSFLWDIKLMDARKHKEFTGADNALILENLSKVAEKSSPYNTRVFVRCIQIPGITDDDDNLNATCEFLKSLNHTDCIVEIVLMNFHHLGRKRYEYLGLEYPMEGIVPVSAEEMRRKSDLVRSHGFSVRINM